MKLIGIRHFYQFGSFRLDVTQRLLFRGQDPVPLPPKVLDTLLALAQNRGQIVGKDELMRMVWPDTFVEENNLNQNISVLRKVLGEGQDGRKYIETVPRRGYRFVAPVRESQDDSSAPLHEQPAETTFPGHAGTPQSDTGSVLSIPESSALVARADTILPHRSLILPILVLVVMASAVSLFRFAAHSTRVNPPAAAKSIAVLPFKLLDARAEDEYLGLGMADTLITRLGSSKQVIVRPTSAVRKYTAGVHDSASIGRELQVATVLEGSVRRVGDRIRITVRLVNSRDGALVWADRFDESYTDIFRVEDSISEKLVRSLIPELTSEEKSRLAKRYTDSPEAYQLYLIGRYQWSRTNAESWHKAIGWFNRALEKDPNYALAYTGLADTYVSLAASDLPQTVAMPRAKQAALKALELDPGLTQVRISLGKIRQLYDWDWAGAEEEFRRALKLSPNSADVHREYGAYLASMGGIAKESRS